MKLLFVCLTAFSRYGGIEKFNKAFIGGLTTTASADAIISCLYDTVADQNYSKESKFSGFGGNRLGFILQTLKKALEQDALFIGHINLAVIALAKVLKPSLKIILITHGIEVWRTLSPLKQWALRQANIVLAVSQHTKQELIQRHGIHRDSIVVFPNTIDPFFSVPVTFSKPSSLLERYKISSADKILLSVCRLSAAEAYKGYDTVLKSLPRVLAQYPTLTYVIVGKYDEIEKERLLTLAQELNVQDHFKLVGFVPDHELIDHFLLGDVFTMPSTNEGFGIVYIEAMTCGLPVIAGNADGSVDALGNGELGTLVNPTSVEEISRAIIDQLSKPFTIADKQELQRKVLKRFGFDAYKKRLQTLLQSIED